LRCAGCNIFLWSIWINYIVNCYSVPSPISAASVYPAAFVCFKRAITTACLIALVGAIVNEITYLNKESEFEIYWKFELDKQMNRTNRSNQVIGPDRKLSHFDVQYCSRENGYHTGTTIEGRDLQRLRLSTAGLSHLLLDTPASEFFLVLFFFHL